MRLDTLIPGATALEITGITADSRKVRPGYLFAALHGVAKDGREYIDSAIKAGFRSERLVARMPNCASVLRVKLDRWLAQETEKAGALIICQTRVDEILREGDQIVGVRCGRAEGELYAPIVILCEGVNPQLAISLGMQKRLRPDQAASAPARSAANAANTPPT